MNEPRKKNPTLGVGVLIVVVVLFVIGTVLFNALRSKRDYDETVGAQARHAVTSTAASQAGSATQ
ncbi:hypothetical protein [Paraburkholderia sp. J94]|uniref:hypothetical protein n=1 Tax=Paraburkholderia sp. J94 TaxID=2805441 RepID=UPI002AB2B007|nr:hypothetical protein [Paraburkholderia sp. J94]